MTNRRLSSEQILLGITRHRGSAGGIHYSVDGERCDGGIPRNVSTTKSYYYLPQSKEVKIVTNSITRYLREFYDFNNEKDEQVHLFPTRSKRDLEVILYNLPPKIRSSLKRKIRRYNKK